MKQSADKGQAPQLSDAINPLLKNYPEIMQDAIDLANIGIYQCDLDKKEIYCNARFCKDFDIPSTDPHAIFVEFMGKLDRYNPDHILCSLTNGAQKKTTYEVGEQIDDTILTILSHDGSCKNIELMTNIKEWDLDHRKLILSGITKNCTLEIRKEKELKTLHMKSQKILQLIPDTVIVLNKELRFIDILSSRNNIFDSEKVKTGQTLYDIFVTPDNRKQLPRIQQIIDEVILSQQHQRFYFSLKTEGKLLYLTCDATLYDSEQVILFLQDTTEIEIAQKKLNNHTALLGYALNVAHIKAFLFHFPENPDTDEPSISLYGIDTQALMKLQTLDWSDFLGQLHPEDSQKLQAIYRQLLQQEINDFKIEMRMSEEDLHLSWYELTGSVFETDKAGRPRLLAGSYMNIQERKKYEFQLIHEREKAELADNMKSTYLANMSHEIRTPLNAIVGFSELLSIAEDPEEKQSYIDIIKTNNEYLLHLIGDIIDLSKIEAGILSVEYQEIELNDLMDEIYHTIKLKINKEISFTLEKGESSCPFITDKNRLSQVVINLLNNAIKNTETGGITFGYKRQNEEMYFFVSDSGCGIPQEKLEKIFSRHVMLNKKKQGFGLGLAISKGIVEKFGGQIQVASEVGTGSTFSFTIPVKHEI